ncbi:MAG TPA: M23 family metallopeptidase [Herpetosiphonaceae bacterium]
MFTNILTRGAALFASVTTSGLLLASMLLPQNVEPAVAAPAFQMPVTCGQSWTGTTFTNHNPLYAVDLNRANDYGDNVLASADGTITRIANLGDSSYGRYMIIDHGGGWQTLYAHLSGTYGREGAFVSRGTRIGLVGDSGNVTGTHLHYEQRLNGSAVQIVFNGARIVYYTSQTLTSHNC